MRLSQFSLQLVVWAGLAYNTATASTPINILKESVLAKDCKNDGDDVHCGVALTSVELATADVVKVAPPNATQVEYECKRQEAGGIDNKKAWYVL